MAMSRTRVVTIIIGILLAVVGASIVIGVLTLPTLTQEKAREQFIAALSERLDAKVELKELRFQMWPTIRAEGRGLVIRHRGRTDVPPLITIGRFSAEGSLTSFVHHHVARVDIEGLDIQIPPDHNRDPQVAASDGSSNVARREDATDEDPNQPDLAHTLIVDDLYTMGARL